MSINSRRIGKRLHFVPSAEHRESRGGAIRLSTHYSNSERSELSSDNYLKIGTDDKGKSFIDSWNIEDVGFVSMSGGRCLTVDEESYNREELTKDGLKNLQLTSSSAVIRSSIISLSHIAPASLKSFTKVSICALS